VTTANDPQCAGIARNLDWRKFQLGDRLRAMTLRRLKPESLLGLANFRKVGFTSFQVHFQQRPVDLDLTTKRHSGTLAEASNWIEGEKARVPRRCGFASNGKGGSGRTCIPWRTGRQKLTELPSEHLGWMKSFCSPGIRASDWH